MRRILSSAGRRLLSPCGRSESRRGHSRRRSSRRPTLALLRRSPTRGRYGHRSSWCNVVALSERYSVGSNWQAHLSSPKPASCKEMPLRPPLRPRARAGVGGPDLEGPTSHVRVASASSRQRASVDTSTDIGPPEERYLRELPASEVARRSHEPTVAYSLRRARASGCSDPGRSFAPDAKPRAREQN